MLCERCPWKDPALEARLGRRRTSEQNRKRKNKEQQKHTLSGPSPLGCFKRIWFIVLLLLGSRYSDCHCADSSDTLACPAGLLRPIPPKLQRLPQFARASVRLRPAGGLQSVLPPQVVGPLVGTKVQAAHELQSTFWIVGPY